MSAFTHSARHAISNFSYATTGMSLVTDSGGLVDEDLWIGSLATAVSSFVKTEGIKTIINLSGLNYESETDVNHVRIDVTDRFVSVELIDIYLSIFDKIADAIDEGLSKGPVLVHCAMGINRSAAALVYYLVRSRYSYADALNMVTMANNVRGAPTLTNLSFRHLVKTYETVSKMRAGSVVVGSPGYYSIPLFELENFRQRAPGESEEQ